MTRDRDERPSRHFCSQESLHASCRQLGLRPVRHLLRAAGRAEYWWFFLFTVLVGLACNIVAGFAGLAAGLAIVVLYFLFTLASLIPSLAVLVRRLHDTDHSGWWVFISLIPLIGAIWLIILAIQPGDEGPNRFGAPQPPA